MKRKGGPDTVMPRRRPAPETCSRRSMRRVHASRLGLSPPTCPAPQIEASPEERSDHGGTEVQRGRPRPRPRADCTTSEVTPQPFPTTQKRLLAGARTHTTRASTRRSSTPPLRTCPERRRPPAPWRGEHPNPGCIQRSARWTPSDPPTNTLPLKLSRDELSEHLTPRSPLLRVPSSPLYLPSPR